MIDDVRARLAGIEARFSARTTNASQSATAPEPAMSSGTPVGFSTMLTSSMLASQTAPAQPPWTGTLGQLIGLPAGGTTSAYPYRSAGSVPAAASTYRAEFEAAGARYGVDPSLLAAVAWTESGFNPGAVSHAGALGLMQIMPGTAAGLGVDPRDPVQAIDGAARYLKQQLDRFGDVRLALAAYNAGPGAVQQHQGIPPYEETIAYVGRVLGRYEQIRSSS